ncbi:hypothetical protein LRD18_03485 [Halorhodospira halochloris]|uniref:hypothetical protein n=1 Tax=Halorhodospira halochloris TaxID=1052 RepID=UPI001EE80FBE|nr:hypothetical protein [Halorhodospira halochloris]MCG5529934.1 hypothetical protein [Halorhodospira halochloris]
MAFHFRVLPIVALVALMVLAGCRSAAIYNVDNSSINGTEDVAIEDVEQAIMRAGQDLGWQMDKKEEGHIIATLDIRDHQAVVDIRHNTETYSIEYRDSTNLSYRNGNIHSNYNGWVENLEQRINSNISLLM